MKGFESSNLNFGNGGCVSNSLAGFRIRHLIHLLMTFLMVCLNDPAQKVFLVPARFMTRNILFLPGILAWPGFYWPGWPGLAGLGWAGLACAGRAWHV